MKRIKNFSFLRNDFLILSISGGTPREYPLTYTLEEALEDWCDRWGLNFIKVLDILPNRTSGALGNGTFSYMCWS